MYLCKIEVKETEHKGKGVFLCEDIPAGNILWIARWGDTGKVILAADLADSPVDQKRVERYGLLQPNGDWFLNLDEGKYTNHSASPTCEDTFDKDGNLQYCKALRDLKAGVELTLDYTKACAACSDGVDFEIKD